MNQLLFQAPILALVLTLISSFLVVVVGMFMGRRAVEAVTLIMNSIILSLSAVTMVNVFFIGGSYAYNMGGWPSPIGISYVVDHFSAPLGLVISLVFLATMIYSIDYIEKGRDVKWYHSLRFLMQAGMFGLIFTADFFHIFVMLELMGLSAIILVSFRKEIKGSVEASIKYGIYDILAISIYYLTTAMIYGMFGTMAIAEISAKLGGYVSPVSGGIFADAAIGLPVIVALLVWSFAIGAAIVPQHFWLPDAHSMAPSSISAILSGLLVQINIAVLARLLFDGLRASVLPATAMGLDALLLLGVVSSMVGSAFMLVQTDIKRLIAYSTIANLGLISIGFGLASTTSVSAAYLHIINHAFVKAALFMIAGVFIHATGSRSISSFKGISKSMPFVSFLFLIGALAAIGFPPLSMFWSKLLLMFSVVSEGGIYSYLLIPIIVTVIFETIAQIRVLSIVYSEESPQVSHLPTKLTVISIVMMIIITVIMGVLPNLAFELAGFAAADLVDFEKYIAVVFGAFH